MMQQPKKEKSPDPELPSQNKPITVTVLGGHLRLEYTV
jgi:hypothetical protein